MPLTMANVSDSFFIVHNESLSPKLSKYQSFMSISLLKAAPSSLLPLNH